MGRGVSISADPVLEGVLMDQEEVRVQALLAEYSALRNEILQRLSGHWIMFAFQLTVAGVLFSFALTSSSRTGFLLIIPIVSYAVSAEYLRNERMIRRLGEYIRLELSTKIPGVNPLGWESWRLPKMASESRIIWLSPLPVTSPGVSFIALAWTADYIFARAGISIADRCFLGLIWVLGFAVTLICSYNILLYKREVT
jgi:hypothetical protein